MVVHHRAATAAGGTSLACEHPVNPISLVRIYIYFSSRTELPQLCSSVMILNVSRTTAILLSLGSGRKCPERESLGIARGGAPQCGVPANPVNSSRMSSMLTIVLATQKGGSGKSTLAIGLALAAKQAGHTVRLIETDPQATLMNWQTRRGLAEPLIEAVHDVAAIEPRLEALRAGGVTLAIIDTAGGVSAATTAAIRHADLCMIPARPSVADIEATASTLQIVRAWKKPFAFILNQTPIRGARITNAATTLGDEAALELSDVLAQPFIVMRNDHQDALAAGLAVSEYAPTGKSAGEIRELWQWTEAKLNGRTTTAEVADEQTDSPFPIMFVETSAETQRPVIRLAALRDGGPNWDACL